MYEMAKQGKTVDHGFDLFVHGDLPDASGLSSSASIELLIGNILNKEFNWGVDQLTLVKNGQAVENDYLGLNTGIMDQFAIGMGKKIKQFCWTPTPWNINTFPLNWAITWLWSWTPTSSVN